MLLKSKEYPTIDDCVQRYLSGVADNMNKFDPNLRIYLQMIGSSSENTKTGVADEWDYQLQIGGLENVVEVVKEHNDTVTLMMKDDNGEKTWAPFLNAEGHLVPALLYRHMEKVICIAMADEKLLQNNNFFFLYQSMFGPGVFLEWAGKLNSGLAIKLDVVFAIDIPNYWPKYARKEFCFAKSCPPLMPHINILLRPNCWRPSSCLQEGYMMLHLPHVLRLTYMLAKIINAFVDYPSSRQKVHSYDLKNAILYMLEEDENYAFLPTSDNSDRTSSNPPAEGQAVDMDLQEQSTGTKSDVNFENDDGTDLSEPLLLQVRELTWRMCDKTLRNMFKVNRKYFFEFRWCTQRLDGYETFMRYVNYVLNKSECSDGEHKD